MNDLLHIGLLVLGPFATMSALLYVLARIDPQTDSTQQVPVASLNHSAAT